MFNGYVTSEKDEIRRAVAVSDAHTLTLSSLELATEADHLSISARQSGEVIDIDEIEAQLSKVRRRCADVRSGVDLVIDLAPSNIDTAEARLQMAKELFSDAEHTYNQASFEINFATTTSDD